MNSVGWLASWTKGSPRPPVSMRRLMKWTDYVLQKPDISICFFKKMGGLFLYTKKNCLTMVYHNQDMYAADRAAVQSGFEAQFSSGSAASSRREKYYFFIEKQKKSLY